MCKSRNINCMCWEPLALFWKLKFLLLSAGLRTNLPAVSRPHPAHWVVCYWTAPTHYHHTHFLLEELTSHSPFQVGAWGFKYMHTPPPRRGLKDHTKRKAIVKCQPAAVSSNGGRLTNPAIKKTYTRRLNVTFPNNSNFKGIKSLSMLYPKQSFSKRLNQSIRNDSQTHSPQSPVISTQNVLASSKFTSNMEQKRLLWKLN